MSAAIDGDTSSISTSLGGRSSAEVTRTPVSILPPWRARSAAKAEAIACEPPSRHHPSLGVRGDDQHQPDRAGHRPIEPGEGMRGHAGPQRLGLLRLPLPGQGGRRQHRRGTETSQRQRVSRDPKDRLRSVGEQGVEVRRHRLEHPPPSLAVTTQSLDRPIHRSIERTGRTVVERMGAVHFGLQPGEPVGRQVEPGQERRSCGEWMDRGAVIVHQPGDDHLRAARSAADFVARFEHGHVESGAGQPRRGGEPVRPTADDDRRGHDVTGCCAPQITLGRRCRDGARPARTYPGSVHVTVCGIGPLGSHGCSLYASSL